MGRPKKDPTAVKPAKTKKATGTTGKSHGTRKLTDEAVLTILNRYRRGEKQTHLAKEYGVTNPTIGSIVHGRTYKWLTGLDASREDIKKAA